MYAIAIIGDVLSLIPILNIFSNMGTAFALYIAGKAERVDIYSGPGVLLTLIVLVVETVPGFSIFPTWTIRVWIAKKLQKTEAV